MFNRLRAARGAGWRAGMSERRILISFPDGTKQLASPKILCPFKKPGEFLLRFLWLDGFHAGLTQSLQRWLASRRVA